MTPRHWARWEQVPPFCTVTLAETRRSGQSFLRPKLAESCQRPTAAWAERRRPAPEPSICRSRRTRGNTSTYKFNSLPTVNSADYLFPAQTCNAGLSCSPGGGSGGSISPGATTLTLNPVPLGMNGTDVNHKVWITGSTAEACLISAGGTGTSGSPSGTIAITCSNAHTGTWTIMSISQGISEAFQGLGAAGGTVVAPAGTYAIQAAIQVPSNVTLTGVGQGATILQIPNSAWERTNTRWAMAGAPGGLYYCVVCLVASSTNASVRDLTVDENGANQSYAYMPGDISGYRVTNSTYENVSVINRMQGGAGVGMSFYNGGAGFTTSQNNVIQNASVSGVAGCTAPNGGGAYYIEGQSTRIVNTYAKEVCDTAWVIVGNHNTVAEGHGDTGSSVMHNPMYTIVGNFNTIANSHCTSTSGGLFSCFEVGGGASTAQRPTATYFPGM